MTSGELMAILRGFVVRRDMEAANHRNLYTLMFNINRGRGTSPKKPRELWELDIDSDNDIDIDERLEIYKRIGEK